MATQLTNAEIDKYSLDVAVKIKKHGRRYKGLYPIPMGGYPVAIKLSKLLNIPVIFSLPEQNMDNYTDDILIVDDMVDSGTTLDKYKGYDKAVLLAKKGKEAYVKHHAVLVDDGWVIFPWEKKNEMESSIESILRYIGDDISREGLKETPIRMIKSWRELFAGYRQNPEDVIKLFKDGNCNEMVILKNMEFYSTCEHHFLPFFGKIAIGYLPNGKVLGVSKLARLVEIFSRRLQVQERLVAQIADSIEKYLSPKGVMVIAEAQHLCMTSRGVKKQGSVMVTSAIRGEFEKNEVRQEFMSLINR